MQILRNQHLFNHKQMAWNSWYLKVGYANEI